MVKTLSEPMFEINHESNFYKKSKWRKDQQLRINEIIDELASELGFEASEFRFYGSGGFGFDEYSEGFKKFKSELTKNADNNGIYRFKKSSKSYKLISPRLVEVDKITQSVSPFALHDIFGINNVRASQWVGERLFVEVKDAEATARAMASERRSKEYEIEPVKAIPYKEYLQLILETV